MKKTLLALAMAATAAVNALPAAACGGLVAPNGSIRLTRATTLVAYHEGVEHYLTSFSYQGTGFSNFGWIVPLPAAPEKVEEGGGWTLQRLERETHPQRQLFAAGAATAGAEDKAAVLQQVQVRALDITILKGSGQAIVDWTKENGFFLSAETKAHLMVYAHGSQFFMAAKYDAARAAATGQLAGDGAPVLLTMKLPHPWVPLEILANGVQQVNADVYFITDTPLSVTDAAAIAGVSSEGQFVPGAPGLAVQRQLPMNGSLFRDLSTDKNMGWMPRDSWLTYMTLEAPASTVEYDMGISLAGVIKVAPYGTKPMSVVDGTNSRPAAYAGPTAPLGSALVAAFLLAALAVVGGATWAYKKLG